MSTVAERVLVVGQGTTASNPWAGATGEDPLVLASDAPVDELRRAVQQAGCVVVDGALRDPVAVARKVQSIDPAVQTVIVAAPEEHHRVQRAVLFAPGLGEVWIIAPAEVEPGLVERATEVTRQRRSYNRVHARIEHELALVEPHAARRAFVSDAFLAALLGALPVPVIAIDSEDRVLSWNPAAERVLGHTRDQAIGNPLGELVAPRAAERVVRALASAKGERWVEIEFEGSRDGGGVAELSVVAVEAAGHRVRVVILHDVTAQRRVQADLEAQTAELEMQTEELQTQARQLEETQLDIEAASEELRIANAALAAETAAAETARVAAERARAEAEGANRAKSDFLATMSHELRTPINAITGYSDLLDLGLAGALNEQQTAYLTRIKSSTRHLLGLINEVLDLAKVESGRQEVQAELVPVAETAREALDLVGPAAATAGVRLVDEVVGAADSYVGDRDRVRQILVNLLSNAVKFTDAGGQVTVRVGRASSPDAGTSLVGAGPWVRFEVEDTGIGISESELHSVFEPFVQVDSGLTRERGGTGLGLTISRRLARLMNGDLTARSEVGRGSCFTLWLRASSAEADAADAERGFWATAAGEVPRLAEVGHALVRCADDIVKQTAARLRVDPATPRAAQLDERELEDHTATFLVDIGLALASLDQRAEEPSLLRDGREIQRAISELHGARRAREGWSEPELRREFALIREVTVATLHTAVPGASAATLDHAVGILERLLAQAEEISVRGLLRTAPDHS